MLHARGFGGRHAQRAGRWQLVHREPPAPRIARCSQALQRIVLKPATADHAGSPEA
jgi:hypothetical protein